MIHAIHIIRSAIFYLGYAIAMVALGFYAFGLKLLRLSPEKNYQLLIGYSRLMIAWARIACGIRYEIIGQENIPSKHCVIVSNHQSVWETYFFQVIFNPLSSVVKIELLNIPLFGRALSMISPIAIDRSRPALALKQLIRIGKEKLASGRWVIIFPEGTRVKPGETKRYGAGGAMLALAANVDILPVAHNAGSCWPAGTFTKTPGCITVVIGEAISVQGKNREELMQQAEHWIRQTSDRLVAQRA
ncbi:MAG: lysophospholipid acyltransferase family protein [Oleiphilaceae bacterium]|nr:lysophospholipid acyltransferase family protein [Oleiphilaceae bacterium]